jgi:hypothetical protein
MTLMSQVAKLIVDSNVCLGCLSLALNLGEGETQAAIDELATSILIVRAAALCAWCKTVKQTLRVPTHY